MIYRDSDIGVFKIENDMSASQDLTIGFRVGDKRKVVTFQYKELPKELIAEFAAVTNKIARFADKHDND